MSYHNQARVWVLQSYRSGGSLETRDRRLRVSVTGKLEEFVNEKVSEGSYENADEVVRDALRRLRSGFDRSDRTAGSEVVLVQVREIGALLALARDQLDQMNDLSEEESLRLQMAMDRISKLTSTLSNIMKKVDETAQTITQNLK